MSRIFGGEGGNISGGFLPSPLLAEEHIYLLENVAFVVQ